MHNDDMPEGTLFLDGEEMGRTVLVEDREWNNNPIYAQDYGAGEGTLTMKTAYIPFPSYWTGKLFKSVRVNAIKNPYFWRILTNG